MHRFFRRLGKTLAALLAVLLAYLLAAFILGSIVLAPERHGRRDIILEEVGGVTFFLSLFSRYRNPVDGGVERLERGHVNPTFRS